VIYPKPADEIDDAARDELEASAEPAAPPACRWSSAAAS
jgi:hypothetical protein